MNVYANEVNVRLWSVNRNEFLYMQVRDIKIQRSMNEPTVLTCKMLRDQIQPQEGDHIAVKINGASMFFGYIKTIEVDSSNWAEITAYDNLWFFSENGSTFFLYEDMTAKEVLERCIKENQLEAYTNPEITETFYKIPFKVEENTSYLDIILNACQDTYDNLDRKYVIYDDYGNICLKDERQMASMTNIRFECTTNEDFRFKIDGTKRFTAVRIDNEIKEDETDTEDDDGWWTPDPDYGDDEDDEWWDPNEGEDEEDGDSEEEERQKQRDRKFESWEVYNQDLIDKFGYHVYREGLNEGENGQTKAETLWKQHCLPEQTLSLSRVFGEPSVRGGSIILVDVFTNDRKDYIRGWFTVNTVTHNISEGTYTMDIDATLHTMFDNYSQLYIQLDVFSEKYGYKDTDGNVVYLDFSQMK